MVIYILSSKTYLNDISVHEHIVRHRIYKVGRKAGMQLHFYLHFIFTDNPRSYIGVKNEEKGYEWRWFVQIGETKQVTCKITFTTDFSSEK